MQYLWLVYALSAAIMWGVGYVFSERLLKEGLSPAFLLLIQCLLFAPFYAVASLKFGQWGDEIRVLTEKKEMLLYFIISGAAIIGGNLFIYSSVVEKNASLASLIEITYPFFVILFAWLFFKEAQVNIWTFIGGILIFSGVMTIYLKS